MGNGIYNGGGDAGSAGGGGSEEGFLSWPRCSELSPGEMQVEVPRSRPAPWTMDQCSLRVKWSLQ